VKVAYGKTRSRGEKRRVPYKEGARVNPDDRGENGPVLRGKNWPIPLSGEKNEKENAPSLSGGEWSMLHAKNLKAE